VQDAWANAKFEIERRFGKLWPTSLFGLLLRFNTPVNKRHVDKIAKLKLRYLIDLKRAMYPNPSTSKGSFSVSSNSSSFKSGVD
jgi:hypothetical protein